MKNIKLNEKETDMMRRCRKLARDFQKLKNIENTVYNIAEELPKMLAMLDRLDIEIGLLKDAGIAVIELNKKYNREDRNKRFQNFDKHHNHDNYG